MFVAVMKSSKIIVTEGDRNIITDKSDVDKSMHETFSVFIILQNVWKKSIHNKISLYMTSLNVSVHLWTG